MTNKRFLPALFALLIAVSVSAVAQDGMIQSNATTASSMPENAKTTDQRRLAGGFAREIALGGGGAYSAFNIYNFNPFLRNDTYILVNPAYIGEYGDYVWGNFDGLQSGLESQTFAGANFMVSSNLYLGLLVNTKDAAAVSSQEFEQEFSNIGNIENSLGFLVGYRLSPMFNLGLQVYTGSLSGDVKTEAPNNTTTSESSLSTLGFDLGGVYSAPDLRGEAAIKLRFNSRTDKFETSTGGSSTSEELKLDGGMELGFNARAFFKLNNTYQLVPTFSFYNFSWKTERTPAPPTAAENSEYSSSLLEVGLGLNAKTKNALLIGGISFVSGSTEITVNNLGNTSGNSRVTTNSSTILPRLNLGLEYYALDWLTVRLGYFKIMGSAEEVVETRTGNSTTKTTETSSGVVFANNLGDYISVGMGMHFGDWNMNFAVNETFLRNGPNLVSGASTSPLFAVFSSSYRF